MLEHAAAGGSIQGRERDFDSDPAVYECPCGYTLDGFLCGGITFSVARRTDGFFKELPRALAGEVWYSALIETWCHPW